MVIVVRLVVMGSYWSSFCLYALGLPYVILFLKVVVFCWGFMCFACAWVWGFGILTWVF